MFADKLKTLRVEKNLSQRALSRRSGITQAAISFVESGRHNPRPKTAEALADGLGVSVADLYGIRPERPSATTTQYVIN